ncbi:MAG: YaaA family protein [Oscillospiraceae bacterium]|nr:YaaA family protein [Oscillospiraceae bacterium]
MIAILSPAKNMRETFPVPPGVPITRPLFLTETMELLTQLRTLSAWELESAFRVNPQIALDAFCHFQDFDPERVGIPSLYAYAGLAFTNLGAGDFTVEEMRFANDSLRILSGFYGLLRPCDGVLPYRLEMGCKLRFDGKTVYQFWGDKMYRALFSSGEPVINLASKEYSKAIEPYLQPTDRFITCEFVTFRKGKYTTIATSAKMARGQMCRFLVKERLTCPEQLCAFSWEGYTFVPERSDDSHYCFVQ